tara:strand:- start:227 stop:433 length:207 start_codon:yes stop_codon:yes gene_type:complete
MLTIIFFCLIIISSPAHAYIGPGLGIGIIAAIFGFIISLLIFIFAIFWFPIKKILKKIKHRNKKNKLS